MELKEWFLKKAELDYCVFAMTESLKKIHKDTSGALNDPLIEMIDKACGYTGFDYRDVAMSIWHAKEVIKRSKELDIDFDGAERIEKGLTEFMIKNGQGEILKKAFEEI